MRRAMSVGVRAALVASTVLAVMGCESMEPQYQRSQVVFDETLTGTWEEVREEADDNDEPAPRLIITAQAREEKAGRLNPPAEAGFDFQLNGDTKKTSADAAEPKPTAARPNAYQIEASGTGGGEVMRFSAYLIEIEPGKRMVGFQVAESQLEKAGGFALVLPLHHFFKFEQEDDAIVLRMNTPGRGIAWMPWIRIPDADRMYDLDADLEDEGQVEEGLLRVSDSIERVLSYYREHWDVEAFWADQTLRYRRVAGEVPITPPASSAAPTPASPAPGSR